MFTMPFHVYCNINTIGIMVSSHMGTSITVNSRFDPFSDPKPLLLPEDMTDHPLQKEEKARAPLKDLLDLGEIVERDPVFLFFEEANLPTEESKPEGQ